MKADLVGRYCRVPTQNSANPNEMHPDLFQIRGVYQVEEGQPKVILERCDSFGHPRGGKLFAETFSFVRLEPAPPK